MGNLTEPMLGSPFDGQLLGTLHWADTKRIRPLSTTFQTRGMWLPAGAAAGPAPPCTPASGCSNEGAEPNGPGICSDGAKEKKSGGPSAAAGISGAAWAKVAAPSSRGERASRAAMTPSTCHRRARTGSGSQLKNAAAPLRQIGTDYTKLQPRRCCAALCNPTARDQQSPAEQSWPRVRTQDALARFAAAIFVTNPQMVSAMQPDTSRYVRYAVCGEGCCRAKYSALITVAIASIPLMKFLWRQRAEGQGERNPSKQCHKGVPLGRARAAFLRLAPCGCHKQANRLPWCLVQPHACSSRLPKPPGPRLWIYRTRPAQRAQPSGTREILGTSRNKDARNSKAQRMQKTHRNTAPLGGEASAPSAAGAHLSPQGTSHKYSDTVPA